MIGPNQPQSLAAILSPSRNPSTGKLLTISPCPRCGKRLADKVTNLLCSVCFRAEQFAKLPPEEKQRAYLATIPERYIGAEIADLAPPIQASFGKDAVEGVMLWGTPGSGKTYAMAALAKSYIASGFIVRREHWEMLCLKLRDTFNPSAKQTEWQIIEPLVNCDKLFLEDIGTSKRMETKESDFSVRTLQVLIDIRMEHCRSTFVTTNKSIETLSASFDERIADRLRTFEVFQMKAASKR